MKAGRNDTCPCGSGKKFKKCCQTKAAAVSAGAGTAPQGSQPSLSPERPPLSAIAPRQRPGPPDPAETRWEEFTSQEGADRCAVFLRTLDDKELMTDEMAFEMLSKLHEDAVLAGEQARFTEFVNALADRLPDVYQESAHYYLSWQLEDALATSPQDVLPLARKLAGLAGEAIDIVKRSIFGLAYHGRLPTLVEVMRIAWPAVRSSSDIVPWGISNFAEMGAYYEIYNYLEHSPSPDPSDHDLLDGIRFFIAELDPAIVTQLIGDFTDQASPAWTLEDFALKPVRKNREWDDDEDDDEESPDPGPQNLSRLITQFVGYLRREEGVPYPKGELIRKEFLQYFILRHEGDLNPRLSMLEQARNPRKKLPRPPKPGHPLCPERVTFEVHLSGYLGMMSGMYHTAAALFEIVPAWLRFLESRGLIDADRHAETVEQLRPLHPSLQRLMESYRDDPTLFRNIQAWPRQPEQTGLMAQPCA